MKNSTSKPLFIRIDLAYLYRGFIIYVNGQRRYPDAQPIFRRQRGSRRRQQPNAELDHCDVRFYRNRNNRHYFSIFRGAAKAEAMEVGYVSISANFIISLFISAAIYIFAKPLLLMMGLSANLLAEAGIFLQIVGGLSFVQALIMTFSAILKSYGYTKDTMVVTIGMNILNIAGNYLVIFGPFGFPVLGVAGVAMSTSIARIIGLLAIALLVKSASACRCCPNGCLS